MTSHSERVRQLFDAALDLTEAERAQFLAQECAGDEALRAEVQGLLDALAEASGFLVERTGDDAEGPGATIDRYTLLERIGEGGFGVVFRAEQREPIHREVAFKVIKLGMDTRRVIARFALERQALARMQHPHIATVLDGGTTPSGRPYFVMELVRGLPITRFCREHGLGVEERVALLQQVCLAVQHAHHKGLVHRDLKPANVLVARQEDGTVAPKVIDFGIAKAMGDDDEGHTLTQHGQPLGTLEYMAPEQTDGGVDVDARADVYSLGVMLYELLTGRRPFERADAPTGNATGLIDRIRCGQVVRPSVRVLEPHGPEPLPGADRRRWARHLRDELDWIVLRALAKDPGRRYPTPNALAEDLGRFLDQRPVEAGPPAALYQLRCFVARHRLAVAASVFLVGALVAAVAVTTNALAEAQVETARQTRSLQAMRQMLLTADPVLQKGHDYTVRQMLDEFAAGLGASFDDDPVVARDLHLTVGGSYRNLGQLRQAEQHLARALELAKSTTGGAGEVYERTLHEWANLLREAGRIDASEAAIDELLALPSARGEVRMRRLLGKGDLRRLHGDAQGARAAAEEVLALAGQDGALGGGLHAASAGLATNRAAALDLLGYAHGTTGDQEDSLRCYEEALALREQHHGEQHIVAAISHVNIADALRAMGDVERAGKHAERALTIQRRAFGEHHPEIARTLSLCGDLLRMSGDREAAAERYEQAQRIRVTCLPEGHVDLATGHQDRARMLLDAKDWAGAADALRSALAIREGAGATTTHAYAAAMQNLGVALAALEQFDEAERCYRRAHELHLRHGGEQKAPVADCLCNLGLLLQQRGDAKGALELQERSLALRSKYRPEDVQELLASHAGIAAAARALGDHRRAAQADEARANLLAAIPGEHPQRIAAERLRAGREYLDAGDAAAATPLIELVHAWCEEHLAGEWPLGEASSLLAECRLAAGDSSEALRLAELGSKLLEGSPATPQKKQRATLTLTRARKATTEDGR